MILFFSVNPQTNSINLMASVRVQNVYVEHFMSLGPGDYFGGLSFEELLRQKQGTIDLDEETKEAQILDLQKPQDIKVFENGVRS